MRLVTLALSGERPVASSAGNEISDPPPATALIAPVVTPAAASSAISAASIGGGVCPSTSGGAVATRQQAHVGALQHPSRAGPGACAGHAGDRRPARGPLRTAAV